MVWKCSSVQQCWHFYPLTILFFFLEVFKANVKNHNFIFSNIKQPCFALRGSQGCCKCSQAAPPMTAKSHIWSYALELINKIPPRKCPRMHPCDLHPPALSFQSGWSCNIKYGLTPKCTPYHLWPQGPPAKIKRYTAEFKPLLLKKVNRVAEKKLMDWQALMVMVWWHSSRRSSPKDDLCSSGFLNK